MTYDHKLYIFEEIDYKAEFQFLEISAQKINMDSQAQQNQQNSRYDSNSSVSGSSY